MDLYILLKFSFNHKDSKFDIM